MRAKQREDHKPGTPKSQPQTEVGPADMDSWHKAWRELWEVERDGRRDELAAKLSLEEATNRSLMAQRQQQLDAQRAAELSRDLAVAATKAAAEREEKVRAELLALQQKLKDCNARATLAEDRAGLLAEQLAELANAREIDKKASTAMVAAARDEINSLQDEIAARRHAAYLADQKLNDYQARASLAENRAGLLAEQLAELGDARELDKKASTAMVAAARDEIKALRDELAARIEAAHLADRACSAMVVRKEDAESEARQLRMSLATSGEERRVLELDGAKAEAQLALREAELDARNAELAHLAVFVGSMCSSAQGGGDAAEMDELDTPTGRDTPADAEMSVHGEAVLRDASDLHAMLRNHAVGNSTLLDEVRRLDHDVDHLGGRLRDALTALAKRRAVLEEHRARADTSEAALVGATGLADEQRSEIAQLRGELDSLQVAARAAEASFAEALVAIRGPADAQLAVQSERIRVWESLVEGDGLRAEAWNMNATAAIQLIRGRQNLGELGELIREERELIAEQGRLLADAWSSRVQPMVQPSTAAYAHPHAHPHDSSILTSPGAGSRRGLTLYP